MAVRVSTGVGGLYQRRGEAGSACFWSGGWWGSVQTDNTGAGAAGGAGVSVKNSFSSTDGGRGRCCVYAATSSTGAFGSAHVA